VYLSFERDQPSVLPNNSAEPLFALLPAVLQIAITKVLLRVLSDFLLGRSGFNRANHRFPPAEIEQFATEFPRKRSTSFGVVKKTLPISSQVRTPSSCKRFSRFFFPQSPRFRGPARRFCHEFGNFPSDVTLELAIGLAASCLAILGDQFVRPQCRRMKFSFVLLENQIADDFRQPVPGGAGMGRLRRDKLSSSESGFNQRR